MLMGGFLYLGFDLPLAPKPVVLNLSSFLEVLGKGPRALLSFETPGLPRLRFEDREAEGTFQVFRTVSVSAFNERKETGWSQSPLPLNLGCGASRTGF